MLVAELGLEPGPGLRRLEQSILAADPELDLPATPVSTRAGGADAPPRKDRRGDAFDKLLARAEWHVATASNEIVEQDRTGPKRPK